MMEIIWILWYIVVVAILMVSGFNTNMQYDSLSRALGSQSHVYVDNHIRVNVSFASDERYWSAHCSHGWAKDSTCDGIALRAQSCEFSTVSTYCSTYKNYLLQLNNK